MKIISFTFFQFWSNKEGQKEGGNEGQSKSERIEGEWEEGKREIKYGEKKRRDKWWIEGSTNGKTEVKKGERNTGKEWGDKNKRREGKKGE